MMILNKLIEIVQAVPEVQKYLTGRAGMLVVKGATEYQFAVEDAARKAYSEQVDRDDFIALMAAIIAGQLAKAYRQAYFDAGNTGDLPQYLTLMYNEYLLSQYEYIGTFYDGIMSAKINGRPVDSIVTRARLWANRYDEVYEDAIIAINERGEIQPEQVAALIAAGVIMGGKRPEPFEVNVDGSVTGGGWTGRNLEWVYSPEKEHCPECELLNGIVAPAAVWKGLGVEPKNAPNDNISCGGWNCGCELLPTDKKATPNARAVILSRIL